MLFQSYQFRQINPDQLKQHRQRNHQSPVSIVSIQADQSRLNPDFMRYEVALKFQSYQFRQINPDPAALTLSLLPLVKEFQSYQFRQINPDVESTQLSLKWATLFQSYQFRQINPDVNKSSGERSLRVCFNRINSGRSIPTRLGYR